MKVSRACPDASSIRRRRMRPMPLPPLLASYCDQSLCLSLAPPYTFLDSTSVRLIDLHGSVEPITAWADHRPPQFVQPGPSGDVAPQTEDPLEVQGAGAVLLRRDPPDRAEPQRQRFSRVLENRAGSHRRVMLTAGADQQPPSRRPRRPSAAPRADKPVGPPQFQEIVPARLFGAESRFQLGHGSRKLVHGPDPITRALLESTK